jgi:O-methyltransferase
VSERSLTDGSKRQHYARFVFRGFVWLTSIIGYLAIILCLGLWTMVESQRPTEPEMLARVAAAPVKPPRDSDDPRELYLELLKRTLTRYQFGERFQELPDGSEPKERLSRLSLGLGKALLASSGFEVVRVAPFDPVVREYGIDWPLEGVTMVGIKRLDNLQQCVVDVVQRNVPGDLIECGAWRGGACIFMRAVLKAYGDKTRKVWVADSFQGLPKPAHWDPYFTGGEMAVSLDEVKQNFRDYGMLDERVVFLKGFFADTLPKAPIERLAILRLDGDLYESTMDSLNALYDRVSPGGYVIVDDWNLIGARKAVLEFRASRKITDQIFIIDRNGVFWRKS